MKVIFLTISLILSSIFCFAQKDTEKLNKLLAMTDSIYKSKDYKKSKQLYQIIDSLITQKESTNVLILVKKRIAKSFIETGDFSNTIVLKSNELFKLAQETDDCYHQIEALLNLTASYTEKRQFDKATEYQEKALKILENENFPLLEMYAKRVLSFVYIVNKDFENAIRSYREALVLATELNDYRVQNIIYGNLGHCYIVRKEYEKAIEVCKTAIRISKKHNFNPSYIVPANIGESYRNLEQYDSAMYYYKKSYRLAKVFDNKLDLSTIHLEMGLLYSAKKQYPIAIEQFLKSYAFADTINNFPAISKATLRLSETYQEINNYKNALTYLKKYQIAKDTLYSRSTQKKLEEFQVKYETKQKEEQIAALDKENILKATIIQQEQRQKKALWLIFTSVIILISLGMWIWQRMKKKRLLAKQENLRFKAVIEAEQKERKRIAQDLHDSLGQSISVIKIQASTLQPTLGDESKHKILIQQLDNAYDELRDVSHNIMPNTLIMLGLVPAVRELISEISVEYSPKIELKSDLESEKLNEDQVITLYRIIQEALSNILKHAEATLVNIRLETKNGMTSLYIQDNGKGMNILKINNNNGMGWKNIYSRVALLSGKINVTSRPNHGTSITIHLKK